MRKVNEKLMIFLMMGLIVHQHQVNSANPVMLVVSVLQIAWSVFEMINTLHDTYSKLTGSSTSDLLEKSGELAQSVENWGGRIEDKIQKAVEDLLTRLPLQDEITDEIGLLNTYIGRIDELYGDVNEYFEHPEHFSNRSVRGLIKSCISHDGDDVQGTIAHMHGLIVPNRLSYLKKSLFLLLAQQTQEWIGGCSVGASPQQRLVDLFDIVIESEMRGFVMMGFGYLLKGYMESKNFTADLIRARDKLITRAQQYRIVLKNTMFLAGTQFRRCDPPEGHVRGVTFYEFERFLQSFVVQESIFRPDATCPEHCGGYPEPAIPYYGCDGFACQREEPNRCLGRITNCQSLEHNATVCVNNHLHPRRYEWYIDENGRVYGDEEKGCSANITYALKRSKCQLCTCICIGDTPRSKANRFISLREQITDVGNNMVVTGVAFVMINRVLHIRVMQGQLAPRGEIMDNSTVWLELEDIQYYEEESIAAKSTKFYRKDKNGDKKGMVVGMDVAVLIGNNRRIHLDAIKLPLNCLVTGIRFRQITESETSEPIQLEVQGTRFDDETGQLYPDSSTWFTPDDMPYAKKKNDREKYRGDGFRNPILSVQTSINSRPYSFIDIHWSSLEYDAGQTTLPLLDALPVLSDPPSPLIGVGLYHKAQPGYGGFLTFVLEGIDKSPYLTIDS